MVAKVQESVEVPDPPVTVEGVRLHALLSEDRATSPVNALTGDIVIVEVPALPTVTLTVVGLAEMVKSGRPVTVYVTVAEWDKDPLVPVTVTVTVPVLVKVQDKVEVPEPPVTLIGVRVQAVLSAASATLPAKPLTGLMVIIEVPAELTATLTEVGFAAIVKSTKLKVAVAVWTRDPLVPVTVRSYEPATVALQDTVVVPEPVILPGVIAPHVRPAGTVSVSVTTPANPLTAVIVMVDVAD